MTGHLVRARAAVARTLVAVRGALARRESRLLLAAVTLGYFSLYLYILGHLRFTGDGGFEYLAVSDPLSRMFQTRGALSFEPVAAVVVGPLELLVSPVNVTIGAVLGVLVGVNLAVSYLAWRHPAACGIGSGGKSTGLLAGLPALLSGTACCGPVVLIALGIQASGLLIASFGLLVPAAVVLLIGSLIYVGRTVDPSVVEANST